MEDDDDDINNDFNNKVDLYSIRKNILVAFDVKNPN